MQGEMFLSLIFLSLAGDFRGRGEVLSLAFIEGGVGSAVLGAFHSHGMKFVAADGLKFLAEVGEDAALNQYWYTAATIRAMAADLEAAPLRVAFLSTPSVYFSLAEGCATRDASVVFDYDKQWEEHPNYRFYDFNDPQTIPADMHGSFDMCVVDPPFITEDVWRKYAEAVALCLRPGGKVMCTTVAENERLLDSLFVGIQPVRFMPSIPNLPYQYRLFLNYEPRSQGLNEWNDEIPREFETMVTSCEKPVDRGHEAIAVTGSKLSFEEMIERELAKGNAHPQAAR